jgi:hypothetical protein
MISMERILQALGLKPAKNSNRQRNFVNDPQDFVRFGSNPYICTPDSQQPGMMIQ